MKNLAFSLLLLLITIPSYAATTEVTENPSGSVSLTVIKNFTYRVEMGVEKDNQIYEYFKLKNGKYSNRDLLVNLRIDKFKITDLNGDGIKDAVVILVGNYGGSGSFYELTALIGGDPIRQTNSQVLGDRVLIRGIRIKKSLTTQVSERTKEICIRMITHKSTDPMCCPTMSEERCFSFEEGELKQKVE